MSIHAGFRSFQCYLTTIIACPAGHSGCHPFRLYLAANILTAAIIGDNSTCYSRYNDTRPLLPGPGVSIHYENNFMPRYIAILNLPKPTFDPEHAAVRVHTAPQYVSVFLGAVWTA